MILFLSTAFAQAPCATPVDNGNLEAGLDAAMEAFVAMEDSVFGAARQSVMKAVPCLSEPIRPEVAAAVHRIRGIDAFLAEKPDASLYFAAARTIDPSYRFPESVAPEGNPLSEEYLALNISADGKQKLPDVAGVALYVNGTRSTERSANYPSVFQVVRGTGTVLHTSFLSANDDLPTVDGVDLTPPPPPPEPITNAVKTPPLDTTERRRRRGPNVPLLAVAGVAGVAAGGLAVVSQISNRAYFSHYEDLDPGAAEDDIDKLDTLRKQTNTFGYAALIAGGVAVGTGTTSIFVNGRF